MAPNHLPPCLQEGVAMALLTAVGRALPDCGSRVVPQPPRQEEWGHKGTSGHLWAKASETLHDTITPHPFGTKPRE